jgi:hypothetical protein
MRPSPAARWLLTALALAACRDATAPAAPAAPAARPALAAVGTDPGTTPVPTPSVWVTLHVGDQASYGLPVGVPGTTVSFVTNGGYYRTIVDNGTGDTDPEVGYYRVAMPSALAYTAYVRVMPDYLSSDGAVKTVSAFVTPTWVNMGSIILKRKPALYVQLRKQGLLVPGQTIKVTQVGGPWSATIADGDAADLSADGGRIHLRVPFTGTYNVCALTTPSALWQADCVQVSALQYFIAYPVTLTYTSTLIALP